MMLVLSLLLISSCSAYKWVESTPVNPLPENAFPFVELRKPPEPLKVYGCTAKQSEGPDSKLWVGALAYESNWRCVVRVPFSDNTFHTFGPGNYSVLVSENDDLQPGLATPASPVPPNAIPVPNAVQKYSQPCAFLEFQECGYANNGLIFYGTASINKDGNYACVGINLYCDGLSSSTSGMPFGIPTSKSSQ